MKKRTTLVAAAVQAEAAWVMVVTPRQVAVRQVAALQGATMDPEGAQPAAVMV